MWTLKKIPPIYYRYPIIAHIPDRVFIENLLHKLLYFYILTRSEQLQYIVLPLLEVFSTLVSHQARQTILSKQITTPISINHDKLVK